MMRVSIGSGGRSANRVGGRIGATIFGLVFGSIGLFIAIMAVTDMVKDRGTRAWDATPCVVESIEVNSTSDGYRATLSYRYAIDGKSYESDRLGPGGKPSVKDIGARQQLLKTYAKGKRQTCYVNPLDPRQAVLKPASGSLMPIFGVSAFCSIFVLIGYGMAIGVWLPKRASPTTGSSGTRTTGTAKAKIGGILFCSVFIIVGLAVTAATFVRPFLLQRAARSWDTAKAVVLDSTVRSHRGDDSTTYSVYIAYEYSYGGRRWQGDRYRFTSGSSSGYGSKKRVVQQYPKGKSVTVYVDPEDPQQSVIERNAGPALYLGLIPLLFTIVGLALLVAILKGGISSTSGYRRHAARRRNHSTGGEPTRRETTFKQSSGHLGRILGTIAVALFWNGIVSVFVTGIVKDWARGRHPIGETLFISIFVLIGLGIIGGVIYNILRAFNPRIRLENPGCVMTPGASTSIAFRIEGKAHRLERLEMALHGEERATYRRGTDTVTDTHEFHKSILFEAEGDMLMEQGSFRLSIPEGAMHSFASSHNKIVWSLKIHGEVPRWPDVKESYTLDVVPRELMA